MHFNSDHLSNRPQPAGNHNPAVQSTTPRDAMPSGLTREEIRRIVLDLLG